LLIFKTLILNIKVLILLNFSILCAFSLLININNQNKVLNIIFKQFVLY